MILFALRFCRRVHRRVLAPAQSVDLVTQEGRVLKLQQLRRFLHLTGQALDGGLPLHPAHAAGVQLSVLRFIADLDAVCNGLDDGFWHDAMFFIVGHLDGAAALGLGDGAVHAVGDDIRIHDHKALGVAGRAARNAEGLVIMYADVVTDSMDRAITETERRRAIQMAYNKEHGIVPKTIVKAIADSIEISDKAENAKLNTRRMGRMEREAAIERLTREMKEAAKLLEFEHAAFLRDQIDRLRRGENPTVDSAAETERKQNHSQTQRKGRKYLGKR